MSSSSAPALPQREDADLADDVARILRVTLAERREELRAIAPEVASLAGVLSTFLEGGKLLRPRFCFWGGAAVRAPDQAERERLATLGAAIELVQAAALVHDDLIDHSPTRRGRPAVHVAAADDHRARALVGSSEEHGAAVAVVLGDLALTWANALAAEVLASVPAARREYDLLCSEVMAGQYLDILHQAGGFVSQALEKDAALAVIRWKTVPYTVLRPLRLGAALLGADDALLEGLSRYAEAVGRGFQLRDDLLGVIGDEAATGKSASSDIAEGKRTLLLAVAQERADDRQREVLARTVGADDASPEDVAAVRAVLRGTGAIAEVARRVREDADAAVGTVSALSGITDQARAALIDLARATTDLAGLELGPTAD